MIHVLKGRDIEEFMMQIREGRMCIRKGTLSGRKASILFISYHGPRKSHDDNRIHYTNFIENWCLIQEAVSADILCIGGDFNYPVEKIKEEVPLDENGLTVHAQVNTTEHRQGKQKIDYFIVSKSHELIGDVKTKDYGSVSQLLSYDTDSQQLVYITASLDVYFDHASIVATFTASANAGIYNMQRAHFTTVLGELRSTSSDKGLGLWDRINTPEELSQILHSKEIMKILLNTEDLREILRCLKICDMQRAHIADVLDKLGSSASNTALWYTINTPEMLF